LKRGAANRFGYDLAYNNHNWEASTMARQPISGTPSTRVGPFSPAVSGDNLIFVSGQVALDPTSGALIEGDISTQTEQVLRNLAAVLEAAGKNLGDVLRVGVYLTDMHSYSAMNEVYVKHFEAPYPARTAIAVAALPLGAAVEMDAIVAN
jgi:2-iminobutanoate/2-iminopropanoate deaminase